MSDIQLIAGAADGEIAGELHRRLQAALVQTSAPVAICLPGGGTPEPILRQLIRLPLEWRRVVVWPSDDRMVPFDHPASNVGKLMAWLGPVGAQVVPLAPTDTAPHFAFTWIGMGTDGHIASLFPNSDPDPADPELVRQLTPHPLPPEAPFDRVTLTIPALLNCGEVVFVIRGAEKRALFERAMQQSVDLPVARLLRAAHQKVTCFA